MRVLLRLRKFRSCLCNAGASAFTIAINPVDTFPSFLTISGVGITNNSGIMQNFVPTTNGSFGGEIDFTNSATAGSLTACTNYGEINFAGTSTADNATFTNNGGMQFFETSTAGNGTFTNNGGARKKISFPRGRT
jgi:hypothetical protein